MDRLPTPDSECHLVGAEEARNVGAGSSNGEADHDKTVEAGPIARD
jgi:hypothetical protein